MEFNNKLMKQIWKNIDKDCKSGCWLSKYTTNHKGYCQIGIKSKLYGFHRVMLLWSDPSKIFEFENSDTWLACHSCPARNCVNPEHLRWGTHADNANDKIRDGTNNNVPIGENHYRCKLTEEQVLSIRREYEEVDKMTFQQLADKYRVHIMTISDIIRLKTWTHI